jgi:NitT/TauT family transport system substrate-binding protein
MFNDWGGNMKTDSMSTNSRHVSLFLIVFAIIAVTACVSPEQPASVVPPTPALTTIRVAYLPVISFGPLFIAKEEGYFARQGINVEFEKVQSPSTTIPSLINGDIAVSSTLSPAFINAIAKGAHVRIVADKGRNTPGHSCNASGFMVRRDLFESGAVTKLSDLKGRKIMIPAEQDYSLSSLLKRGNLTSDDVETVVMDFPSGMVALRNSAVDGGILTEPFVTQALDSKAAVMLLPTEVSTPDFPFPLLYGPAILDKDPDLGRKFMVAYLEGARQYNQGKTERNLAILSNYTHLDRDLLRRTCWMPIDPDGDLPRQPVRDYMDWMYANKKISQNLDDDQLYDMSYVTYARSVRGNSSGSG